MPNNTLSRSCIGMLAGAILLMTFPLRASAFPYVEVGNFIAEVQFVLALEEIDEVTKDLLQDVVDTMNSGGVGLSERVYNTQGYVHALNTVQIDFEDAFGELHSAYFDVDFQPGSFETHYLDMNGDVLTGKQPFWAHAANTQRAGQAIMQALGTDALVRSFPSGDTDQFILPFEYVAAELRYLAYGDANPAVGLDSLTRADYIPFNVPGDDPTFLVTSLHPLTDLSTLLSRQGVTVDPDLIPSVPVYDSETQSPPPSTVPEPGGLALMVGVGLAAIGHGRRRIHH